MDLLQCFDVSLVPDKDLSVPPLNIELHFNHPAYELTRSFEIPAFDSESAAFNRALHCCCVVSLQTVLGMDG